MAVSVFQTELGWFALIGSDGCVARLLIGHPSRRAAQVSCAVRGLDTGDESDWFPELRARLQRYAEGEPEEFRDVRVHNVAETSFQRRVLRTLQRVRFGETVTYGELAARSGAAGAARAVGRVMARNRVPIVFPCHRVVSASDVGGFSAPLGIGLKRRMLELERTALPKES